MAKRNIILIDEEKCTGCGNCIPGCPEGALQIIDGKARLVSDLFCDGLGACIGECPENAIKIEEREAEPYDEKKVMANIVKQGENVIKAHLEHLKNHSENEYFNQAVNYLKEKDIANPLDEDVNKDINKNINKEDKSRCNSTHKCPGSSVVDLRSNSADENILNVKQKSELRNWPVQITLVPVNAPYFSNADIVIAADCVPFTYGNFHNDFLKGKILLVGCPKLDDIEFYRDKITQIFDQNDIKSVTVVNMEVPCCFGFVRAVNEALVESGKDIPVSVVTISIKGEILER